jgi:hypothetical protein
MTITRVLLAAGGLLGAALLLPDLRGDVDHLQDRVTALEERVTALEQRSGTVAPNGDLRQPLTERARYELEVHGLEEKLGLTPDGLDLAARAWRAKVREASVQAYFFATQVAGNQGLLRADERVSVGSLETQHKEGARIAERAMGADDVGAAFSALEAGVREIFDGWAQRHGGDVEGRVDDLVARWRSAGLSIVREKLEQGIAWRRAIAAEPQQAARPPG